MSLHCLSVLKVTHNFFWYPKVIVSKRNTKLIEKALDNAYMRGRHTSLSYRSINVHHRFPQFLSKETRYIMRVTSNGENDPRRGDCLRG